MFKITGLDKLQRELKSARDALKDLDGELGVVKFDPNDPSSIEAAIQSANRIVDQRTNSYASNSIVSSIAEQMKESYRDGIIKKAIRARLKKEDE